MSHRIEIYRAATEDGDPEYRWRKRSLANGEIVAQGEGHARKYAAIRAAIRANPEVPRERFIDLTRGGLRVQSALLDDLPSEADDV